MLYFFHTADNYIECSAMDNIIQTLQLEGMRLLGGIAVLAAGIVISKLIIKLVCRGKAFKKLDPSAAGMVRTILKALLYTAVGISAAGVLGVPLTSFITILASAGVAVSLAAQGAISNLVGGITILILKPFRAGDFIKAGGEEGTVRSIGTFYTEMTTYDNRHISLPNSSLTNTPIINYTREGTRRVDVVFSVSYSSDMDLVLKTLQDVVEGADKILSDPAPQVLLTECASSSLDFTVRAWCASSDYWSVRFALLESGKRALDRAGLEIPFPQMDVHMR